MAGIYLHIPFCGRKCGYCDFYSITERSGDIRSFRVLMEKEIASAAESLDFAGRRGADTVFFGGGTPSLLDPSDIRALLDAVRSVFGMADGAEITIEANPGTLTPRKLSGYREAGVNRISIGVQSFVDSELRLLGRSHDAETAEEAVRMARNAGFDNIGVDLLFGVPGQTAATLRLTLEKALSLEPEHVSAYGLTVHEGTTFGDRVGNGEVRMPSEDECAEAFLSVSSILTAAGFEHYEVSNYARPGRRCRHNEGYWTHEPYLGFGPSAHSFSDGIRRWNVPDLEVYSSRIGGGLSPEAGREIIDEEKRRIESVGLGLRMSEGVLVDICRPRPDAIRDWVQEGLAVVDHGRLRLTVKGFLLADEIAGELV